MPDFECVYVVVVTDVDDKEQALAIARSCAADPSSSWEVGERVAPESEHG